MVIERGEFFKIIQKVSESEDLKEDNLLGRIKNELCKKDEGKYSTYNNLRIDKIFSVLVDSSKIVNYTLLHLAVECENAKVVECLLKNRIKVDEPIREFDRAKSKLTALHIAASHGYQEIIQLLLDANANPLLENSEGLTPRKMVGDVPNRDAIIKMLEEGEICHVINQSEARATRRQTYRSSNTLLQPNNKTSEDHRNNEQTSLNESNISNDSRIYIPTEEEIREELVESLKEHERDINTQDENGWTMLHYAAANNDEASVKLLIECGTDVNAQDENKRTPLHLAAVLSGIGIVKYLVENGADFNVQDKHGYTPLCYALAYRNYNDTEVVTYLVKSGASVPDQNTNIDKHKISRPKQSEAASSHFKINNITGVQEKARKLRAKSKKSCAQLKDKEDRICSLEKINEELRAHLEQVGGKLEKTQGELAELKDFLAENETRLETLNKLDEENQSLKRRIQDLEDENTTLKDELEKNKNQHPQTNEVSLEKAEKATVIKNYLRKPCSHVNSRFYPQYCLRIICSIDDCNFCDICVSSWRHYIHNVKTHY